MPPVLDYDHIPIERGWELSMILHKEVCCRKGKEPWEWEICNDCEGLASRVIRVLFDQDAPER